MNQKMRHFAPFAVLVAGVFLGLNILSLVMVSTGPHLYLYFGCFELHRYGGTWTIEHFYLKGFIALLLVSGLVSWSVRKTGI
jgi:hypothetical protein